MYDLESDWTDERTPEPVLAVVKIERHGLKFLDADQVWSATSKFTHIEPLEGDDADLARTLLEKAYAKRTGNESLPIPLDEPSPVEEPVLDLDTPLEDKEPAEPEADEPDLDEEEVED